MMRWGYRLLALALVGFLGAANLITQRSYLADSAAVPWETTMARARALRELPPRTPIAMGLPEYPVPALAALFAKGHPAWNIDGSMSGPSYLSAVDADEDRPIYDDSSLLSEVGKRMRETFSSERFYLQPNGLNHHFRRFAPPQGLDLADAVVLLPAPDESVVNGAEDRPEGGRFYVAKLADQRDTLIQVDTSLGHIVTPGHIDDVALWQREADFAGSRGGIQAIGQHVLFEVLGPVPESRLMFDFTSAGLAQQGYALPAVTIYGATEQTLDVAGRGAERLLSAPIEPREVDGHYYVALELRQDLAHFSSARHGVAGLYNGQLAFDPRGLVGFVRNVSLLTPDQAADLQPPAAVSSFPAGLLVPGLQFSGVSEDGWVADHAWFRLAAPDAGDRLRIKGGIPGLGQKLSAGVVKVSVDGILVREQKLTPGVLELDLPIPPQTGARRIDIEATAMEALPQPDGRQVSLHLASIALGQKAGAGPAAQ